MEALVVILIRLRRGARHGGLALAPLALAAGILLRGTGSLPRTGFALILLAALALIGFRVVRRNLPRQRSARRRPADVELGLLLVLIAYGTAVQLDGSLNGRFFPLVYVAIGIVSAFAEPMVALLVVGLSIGFEAGLRSLTGLPLSADALLPHLAFGVVFSMLNAISLRIEMTRLRRASKSELRAERERIRADARTYRLLRAPSQTEEETPPESRALDEERLLRSGLEEIEMSVLFALRLLRQCLGIHTAALLWLDPSGRKVHISELSTDEPDLAEGPFAARDGIVGAALTKLEPLSLFPLRGAYVLPYYEADCPVQAACAVPVFEHGQVQGVLVADRIEPQPFEPREQALLEQAARFCARAIENERIFVQLERTKVEQGRLYRASERLGQALTEQEVIDAGVKSASVIAAVDFAAVTGFDPAAARHHIRGVIGEGVDALQGAAFESNGGLVSMALQNRHPLPYRGEYDPGHHLVFTRRLPPPRLPSLIVLPLLVHDEPLGTLVLASSEVGAFAGSTRDLLEVLASHLAVSLSHARMVRRLEEQATTDPMTGLLNKRAMLETAEAKLRAAKRFGRKLSVLVADIDHFKKVNDTYGHDVGDVVIKGLGAVHERNKRNTDAVARFGGEEFVTICEETDGPGAMLLAERIRTEFEKTTFHAKGYEVDCTCSVGIATYPDAGASWEELFAAADEALYASKRGGRNRATLSEASRSAA
ncbi:MAG: diguanylate cyclase [Myxococcota bacterium]